jgi:hypothetical protein
MKLDTVWKWWNRLRFGLSRNLATRGLTVRPILYDKLSQREQEIVYDYWIERQLAIRS